MRTLSRSVGALLLLASGCTSPPFKSLEDVKPVRTYHASYADIFDAIKLFSVKEDYHLDRFGPEAGRVIGHRSTTSALRQSPAPAPSEEVMLIVMILKVRKISASQTEVNAKFTFESGHTLVSREEEEQLLESYAAFFNFMDSMFGI